MDTPENNPDTRHAALDGAVGNLPAARATAVVEVLAECGRIDLKFPRQAHDAGTWLMILTEEVGESAQAALDTRFGGRNTGRFREEMVQVAAVALTVLQALDEGRCWHHTGPQPPSAAQPVPAATEAGDAPFRYATPDQCDEIKRLLDHPAVSRKEKSRGLLTLENDLHYDAARQYIGTLGQLIRTAENAVQPDVKAAA